MRTYSRKPPSHQQLDNVHELCRLCLEKPGETVPIYEDDNAYSSLALRIMVCVGLEMTKDDGLPNQVCMECHKELERCYTFRKKCENSYQKLKSHMIAVKLAKAHNESLIKQQNHEQEYLPETLIFTIDMDGTMELQGSNARCIAIDDEESLIALRKNLVNIPNLELKLDKCEEIHEQGSINEIIVDNSIAHQNNGESQVVLDLIEEHEKPEDVVYLDSTTADTFVSSMLSTLDIVTVMDDGTLALDPSTSRNVELVSGDGEHILFELTEEDGDMDQKSTSLVEIPVIPQESKIEDMSMETQVEQNATTIWENTETSEMPILSLSPANNPGALKNGNTKLNKKAKDVKMPYKYRASNRVVCGECGKSFASKTVLARHQGAVHARMRPFQCAHCNKRFAQKEVWARHVLVHQEKRPFQCQSCSKSFTQRHSLTTHERLHTPPASRPLTLHQCPQCPKVFLHSSGLSRHMSQHLGRTWSCGACGRSFSDASALRRHVRAPARCTPPQHNQHRAATDTG